MEQKIHVKINNLYINFDMNIVKDFAYISNPVEKYKAFSEFLFKDALIN